MRVFLLRKRHIALMAGIVLTIAIFTAVNLPAAVTTAATARQLPIYCVDRADNKVAISFDAAWGDVRVRQSSHKEGFSAL